MKSDLESVHVKSLKILIPCSKTKCNIQAEEMRE